MKILQINSVCGFGSTGRIAADLSRTIIESGGDCTVAYGRYTAPDDIESFKIDAPFQVELHGVLSRLSDKHGFYSKTATRRFLRWVDSYQPDLVHLHNLHGYYLNVALLFESLKERRLPVLWTLHDCWAFTGHCAYFDFAGCEKWKSGCHHCPQRKEYPASLGVDRSEWNYHRKKELFTSLENMTIVTPSQWLGGIVKQSFLGKYPVRVIPNGIDLSLFRPSESDFRKKHQLENKKIALGVASVWDNRKGLKDFAALSKLLGDDWKIILVGVSEAQKRALPENILVLPRTDSVQELARLYTAADVFVNPSVEETMGLTTVEALACGTPAVVYNATALPEAIDETCGLVVEKGNIGALAAAVADADFSAESCVRRAQKYEKQEKYQEYLSEYHRLAGEK